MSEVVRVYSRYPKQMADAGYSEYQLERTRDAFARELLARLKDRGGIVGPIHETQAESIDYFEPSVTLTVYAQVTDLPQPETYRLMGGPADGRIVRTGGDPTLRIPFVPPVSAGDPYDVAADYSPKYALYERQGDTAVYLFRSVT